MKTRQWLSPGLLPLLASLLLSLPTSAAADPVIEDGLFDVQPSPELLFARADATAAPSTGTTGTGGSSIAERALDGTVWTYTAAQPGVAVKPGTELRILPVGDSITAGQSSDTTAQGDWNGYRKWMRDMLSEDKVVFAGTVKYGSMTDGWTSAWPGRTIEYVGNRTGPALAQRPNIILLHLGINDMSYRPEVSLEGNDPVKAGDRLGALIDKMTAACPDAVVLVGVITPTCKPQNVERVKQYEALIPGVVAQRQKSGKKVVAVDLTSFPLSFLKDCTHPDNQGYQLLGRYWYDFITQIPKDWIGKPVGPPPDRGDGSNPDAGGASDTGGSGQASGTGDAGAGSGSGSGTGGSTSSTDGSGSETAGSGSATDESGSGTPGSGSATDESGSGTLGSGSATDESGSAGGTSTGSPAHSNTSSNPTDPPKNVASRPQATQGGLRWVYAVAVVASLFSASLR
ncbi:SGNH hydrolase-type esterase domain-containing protein [Microdochium trichocladiopsis]|uniref:SGNH hydrolase-type esterase domain-containing protein n=1 Tax=Microdochium trichocladiopsis TaxID=1682393 RepID=A0A9P8XXY3_9PEZI|nr:SGNH hydrolase-type esterase domain-containing protein [Microdochium trichocladiopsis]KAH7024842.1 SGNH hydrolase-type esterase domain-containing protein [Microdochium trichocladiopsis]